MNDPQKLIGTQVDAYRFDQFLASGGMAAVYLGTDVRLNRQVAIKVMLPHMVGEPELVSRFRREAQTAASLEHPNIVQIYAIGILPNGAPYIAMQFVDGGSLRDSLRRLAHEGKLLPTVRALGVIRSLAEALDFAHNRGIVHRDLKPANVLVRQDGRPVLVDLGIAAVKSMPKLTQTGTILGTPEYMSPEQAGGKPLDGRSDLYSLGIILFELLTGRVPFRAPEPMAILHKHIYEAPPNLEQLRPDLSLATLTVVRTLLQKPVNGRYQAAQQLVDALQQAMMAEGANSREATVVTWSLPQESSESLVSRNQLVSAVVAGKDPTIPVPTPSGFRPPPPPPSPQKIKQGLPNWLFFAVGALLIGVVAGIFLLPRVLNEDEPTTTAVVAATATPAIIVVVVSDTPPPATETLPPPTETPLPLATDTPAPTETAELPTPTETPFAGPEVTVIGRSALAVPIEMVRIGTGETAVLFIGGLHAGYAPGTVALAEQAIDYFGARPGLIPPEVTLYIISNASPDTLPEAGELAGRLNANGVDLNRNWDCRWSQTPSFRGSLIPNGGGSAPFSEPETQTLRDAIELLSPEATIFWQARAAEGLSSPGACEGSTRASINLATSYGIAAGYPIADFEDLTNTTLNGDATNWLDSNGYPAISVLLPSYEAADWENNLAGITAVLEEAATE